MLNRIALGLLPEKPHTVFRSPKGTLLQEEMFTRGGFDGPYSYLYHQYPITTPRSVERSAHSFKVAKPYPEADFLLKRRLYHAEKIPTGESLFEARTPLFVNEDLALYVVRSHGSDSQLFANGDGDELWYIFSGSLTLESSFGQLDVSAGDYVHVPRSCIHQWKLSSADAFALLFEARGGCGIPASFRNTVGQLKLDAPYTHRDFRTPTSTIAQLDVPAQGPTELVVKRNNGFTLHHLQHTPFDVVGWDGFAYPCAFPIERYQPKTGLIHLPPTVHTTFTGPGFAICSFVPRVTDTHPQAIPCPYPHSNVDCDELLFYVRGNFTSRRGVGPGCISFHPSGIAHGPHPGAYEASIGTTRTEEMAVMCDTFKPLQPTFESTKIEEIDYHMSWVESHRS